MAWRPYNNLIDGRLDNRIPGKVTGWMRFSRRGQIPLRVTFELDGDFHEDVRGKEIILNNETPSDRNAELGREGTYMEGFERVQRGTVGDMTAGLPLGRWTEELAQKLKAQLEIVWQENGIKGSEREARRRQVDAEYTAKIRAGELYYSYVRYPYLEWYSENGRVVLELDPSQVAIVDSEGDAPHKEKTAAELVADRKKRVEAFGNFMSEMVRSVSEANRRKGGDGNVSGFVVG